MDAVASSWVVIIGAIFTGVNAGLAAWLKYRQDKARETVKILTDHIDRIEKQNRHKDDIIEEMSYLQHRCEVREQASRGWMERASDWMERAAGEIARLSELAGMQPTLLPKLDLPPKEYNTDADKALYNATRAKYNTAVNNITSESIKAKLSGGK